MEKRSCQSPLKIDILLPTNIGFLRDRTDICVKPALPDVGAIPYHTERNINIP